MYRVYRDFIRRMLLICLHYRDLGYGLHHAHAWGKENWWKSRKSEHGGQRIVRTLNFFNSRDYNTTPADLDQLITTCIELLGSTGVEKDRSLVDAIVRTLGLPYAQNVLAGATLRSLQQALLIPEEIAELKRQLDCERFCASCGHPFVPNEMVTFSAHGDIRAFICTRCSRPSYLAADNDIAQHVDIRTIRGLATILAKKHLVEVSPANVAVPDNDVQALANDIIALDVAPIPDNYVILNYAAPFNLEPMNRAAIGAIDQPHVAARPPYVPPDGEPPQPAMYGERAQPAVYILDLPQRRRPRI